MKERHVWLKLFFLMGLASSLPLFAQTAVVANGVAIQAHGKSDLVTGNVGSISADSCDFIAVQDVTGNVTARQVQKSAIIQTGNVLPTH